MSADLPDFDAPPVGEMALGVQFQPLTGLRTPQLGLIWSEYRHRGFSRFEEHPPLPPQPPELPPGVAPAAGIHIEFGEMPSPPRCWFLNSEGTVLLQVQQNRFVHNWRQVAPGERYPRYAPLRASFEKEVEFFSTFLRREGIGEISADQCEVTYVNHLPQYP